MQEIKHFFSVLESNVEFHSITKKQTSILNISTFISDRYVAWNLWRKIGSILAGRGDTMFYEENGIYPSRRGDTMFLPTIPFLKVTQGLHRLSDDIESFWANSCEVAVWHDSVDAAVTLGMPLPD